MSMQAAAPAWEDHVDHEEFFSDRDIQTARIDPDASAELRFESYTGNGHPAGQAFADDMGADAD